MSQEKIDNHDNDKGVYRRSRKDQQGRDYVCGCGKKYLSYPALYTHIKTKHEGNQPEGTQKTGTVTNKRTKQKIDEKLLKQIHTLVTIEDLKVLTELDENAKGTVSPSQRSRRDYIGKQLYETYNNLVRANSVVLSRNTSIDIVLILYLLGVGRVVSEGLYLYYGIFAKLFRNCFHEHIEQIYSSCFKSEFEEKIPKLNMEECKLAPIVSDFFIRFYLPVELKDATQELKALMQLMLYDFCKWMVNKKLSIVKVTLKPEYKMPRKNFIEPKRKQKKESTKTKKQTNDGKQLEVEGEEPREQQENDCDQENSEDDCELSGAKNKEEPNNASKQPSNEIEEPEKEMKKDDSGQIQENNEVSVIENAENAENDDQKNIEVE